MVSEKMKKFVKNSSAIRAMFEDGKIMAAKYGKENVYDYSLGNPSVPPPESVRKAVIEIMQNEEQTEVHGYMSNSGFEDVRQKTAEALNRRHGTNFSKENIIMTVGAAGGINIILKSILNPDDEVMVIAPFFGEYLNYINNYDGKAVVISPDTERFSINFDELEQKINPKTKAVIINSPNNPTGVVYTEEDIKRLSSILEEKSNALGSEIYIISDEPYRELVFTDTFVPYVTKYYKNTFVGYSYSKTLSLPGERIGYTVIPSEMDDFEDMVAAVSVANRISGFVNAPSLFQKAAAMCIDDTSDFGIYARNREILYNALIEYGYECVKPDGAFYMFPKCFIRDDNEFCRIAKEYRLIIVPGSTFGCPGYFRMAYCVSEETAKNSLESFKKLAEKYKR